MININVDDIISQVEIKDGKVISRLSGKEYSEAEFIDMVSKKYKLKKADVEKLRSVFTEFIKPQTKESEYIEAILNKYDFKYTDGVYIIRNEVVTMEDIYRLFWKEERLIPADTDKVIENLEKISERFDLQMDIFKRIYNMARESNGEKSKYLESLDKLYPRNNFRNVLYNILVPKSKPIFHIFYDDGVGGTGKSTLLEVITLIVGEKFTSNVLLSQFSNRFVFANMLGKYVNIGDDDGKNEELQNIGTLKSMITGNRITIDRKNMSPIECRIFAKQIYATNILPYIDFTDGGIMRRLNIIKMNKVIPKTMKMCDLNEDELKNICREVFTSKDIEQVDNELAITTSPLYRFYKESEDTTYGAYQLFCSKYGFKCMNIINFEAKSKFIEVKLNSKEVEPDEIPF